jgi:protease PrsW
MDEGNESRSESSQPDPAVPGPPPPYPGPPGYGPPGVSNQPSPPGALGQFGSARADDWERLREEFTRIRFDQVVPLGAWIRDKPWNLVWVRWFLGYALFPFILLLGARSGTLGLTNAAWGYSLYFSLTWLIVLTLCIRPERLDLPLMGLVCFSTAVVGIPLVLIVQKLPLISSLYAATESPSLIGRLTGFTLGVGLMEEGFKALPLLLFVYRKSHYRPLTIAYIGVVSGLAFGVKEAVDYSHQYAVALRRQEEIPAFLMVQMARWIALPLLHACWSGIVGYFIGLATLHNTAPRALVITGIVVAAVLHGSYDAFAGGFPGVVLAGLSVLVFLSYVRSGDVISKEILAGSVGVSQEGGPR